MRSRWLLPAVFSISAGVFAGVFPAVAAAQDADTRKSGYVTEMSAPDGFALNRQRVLTENTTVYQLMGQGKDKKPEETAETARHAVQLGAYVEVEGKRMRTISCMRLECWCGTTGIRS